MDDIWESGNHAIEFGVSVFRSAFMAGYYFCAHIEHNTSPINYGKQNSASERQPQQLNTNVLNYQY